VLNCREVSRLVASDELADAGLLVRLRVRLHFLICKECRRYAQQLRIINERSGQKLRNLASDVETLVRLERSILENAIAAADEPS